MDKDLAKIVARTAFRSSANLTNLVQLLKNHLDEKEYKNMMQVIGECSFNIEERICRPIYEIFPEIEKEFEDLINKYKTIG